MHRLFKNKQAEGYVDVCVGVVALLCVLVLTINLYSFLTLKQDLDEISEQLIQVATYNGVPLLPDHMVNGGTVGGSYADGVGDIFLIDSDIISKGVIQAPVVEISQNPIMTGRYTRLCDMHEIGEVQVKGMFKGLGKIKHIA